MIAASRPRSAALWAVSFAWAFVVGTLIPLAPDAALVVGAVGVGSALLLGPVAAWAAAALLASILLPGLANLGWVSRLAGLIDIPLAWGALAAAGLHAAARRAPNPGGSFVRLLAALVGVVALSHALNGTVEVVRSISYLLLLGQPLALVVAFVIEPPSMRAVRSLSSLVIALAAIQVPTALYQAIALGLSDPVQGTLYGKGAGAHLVGAFTLMVALWLAASPGGVSSRARPLALMLLPVSFLADAKTPLLASVPMLLASGRRRSFVRPRTLVIAVLAALLLAYSPGQVALDFLRRAWAGEWGKLKVAEVVWREISASPATLLFGTGPATTVSRASFMTTDLLLKPESPVALLGLRPSRVALEVDAAIKALGVGATSFNSGQSSALGVLGDLGILGLVVYLSFVVVVVRRLWETATPAARAVALAWVMHLALGIVFDWWEEPPFTVLLATLTGLELARRSSQPASSPAGRVVQARGG